MVNNAAAPALKEERARPLTMVYYKPNQCTDYDSENPWRTNEHGLVMCTYNNDTCPNPAINYSHRCQSHGGQHGPSSMSRLDRFRFGFIGVEDLDYEELREGVTRTQGNGLAKRPALMRADQYRELVQELYTRHDERMRGLLDKALDNMEMILDEPLQTTIVEGKTSVTQGVSAGDKMNAVKFVWQTVRGKMPENVQVTVDSKPFEKVFEGIARGLSREDSRAIREGTLDVESVEIPSVSEPVKPEPSEEPTKAVRLRTCPDVPELPPEAASDLQKRAEAAAARTQRRRRAEGQAARENE